MFLFKQQYNEIYMNHEECASVSFFSMNEEGFMLCNPLMKK